MRKAWAVSLIGLLVALVLAGILSPFASSHPDGLERVAEDKGFAESAEGKEIYGGAPLPDYQVPSVESEAASTRLAGLIGAAAAFMLGTGLAWVLRARKRQGSGTAAASAEQTR